MTSALGKFREGVSRHVFVGGNFFVQRMLNRYRGELGVVALPAELEGAAARTIEHLQSKTASVAIERLDVTAGRLNADISVENLGGHKFPTAYPSRRAWLHVKVFDRNNRAVFESGGLNPNGSITGNDNDADATRFEPHYAEVSQPDQVQIYEDIMVGQDGVPTTGLLTAVRFIKDNRLLPTGFQKGKVEQEIAPQGGAMTDDDFAGGSTGFAMRSLWQTRRARCESTSNCGSSQFRIAGPQISVRTRPPSRSDSRGTTTRCRRGRPC